MARRSIGFASAYIVVGFMFVLLQVIETHAFDTIESGCLTCHSSGSSVVPSRLQFQFETSWHSTHRSESCSACHPSGAGTTPIQVASCTACHPNATCDWQDFHENSVGQTCNDCHTECSPQTCVPQAENCNDGMDNDCDELVDCSDPDCNQDPACAACVPQAENCNDSMDNDCDELVDCGDPNCNQDPACAACVPQAENCNDSMDNDCDELVDCSDPDCNQDAICSEVPSNDFSTYCANCHGTDGSGGNTGEDIRGESAREISRAIRKEREMKSLRFLTRAQIQAIADFLSANKSDYDHDDEVDCDDTVCKALTDLADSIDWGKKLWM